MFMKLTLEVNKTLLNPFTFFAVNIKNSSGLVKKSENGLKCIIMVPIGLKLVLFEIISNLFSEDLFLTSR